MTLKHNQTSLISLGLLPRVTSYIQKFCWLLSLLMLKQTTYFRMCASNFLSTWYKIFQYKFITKCLIFRQNITGLFHIEHSECSEKIKYLFKVQLFPPISSAPLQVFVVLCQGTLQYCYIAHGLTINFNILLIENIVKVWGIVCK